MPAALLNAILACGKQQSPAKWTNQLANGSRHTTVSAAFKLAASVRMLLQGISQLVGLPSLMMMTCALNSNGQTGHQAVRPGKQRTNDGDTKCPCNRWETGCLTKLKRLHTSTYTHLHTHLKAYSFIQLARTTHNLLTVRLLASNVSRMLATYPFSTAHNSIRRCLALFARAR